jgi:hypothetical protein
VYISFRRIKMAFCAKCGTKLDEGIRFCSGCGSAVGGVSNTPVTPAPLQYVQAKLSAVQASGVYQKLKKNPAIIGFVAVGIVLIVAIAVSLGRGGTNSNIDYIATVNKHRPFVSQGYNTEYGVVFRKFIDSIKYAELAELKDGNVGYVHISGKIKGSGENISVFIRVTPDDVKSDIVNIVPYLVTIGKEKSLFTTHGDNDVVGVLLNMFYAYDEGFYDFDWETYTWEIPL